MLNPILLLSWYLLLRGQQITSLLWVLPLNSNLKKKKIPSNSSRVDICFIEFEKIAVICQLLNYKQLGLPST